MKTKELVELEGKRISFIYMLCGLSSKVEGKVFLEETIVNIIKDGKSTKVKRFNMILKDLVINNKHSKIPYLKVPYKALKNIEKYKIIH